MVERDVIIDGNDDVEKTISAPIDLEKGQSSSSAQSPNSSTIFDEAQECLAHSLLMFLYADLRLLSATGRINTRYETLCIASDRVSRSSAAGLAQLPGKNEFVLQKDIESVSPAQIMAILIVELRKEVIEQRRRAKEQVKKRERRSWIPMSNEEDESDLEDDDAGVMSKIIDRNGRKEFETDMHAMIRTYNDMLGRDLKGIPDVKIIPYPLRKISRSNETSLRMQPIAWMKRASQLGHSHQSSQTASSKNQTEVLNIASLNEINKTKPFESSQCTSSFRPAFYGGSWDETKERNIEAHTMGEGHSYSKDAASNTVLQQSKIFEIIDSVRKLKLRNSDNLDSMSDPGMSSPATATSPIGNHGTENKRPNLKQQLSVYIERAKEDHALCNKMILPTEYYHTFARAEDIGNKLFNMENVKFPLVAVPETSDTEGEHDRNMSEKELLDFMTECIESRDVDRLDFMKDFFKEDTVSRIMVKSKARIVWINDWYTMKDLMYAISVDKLKKRVTVVFRGAITRPDWNHAFDGAFKKFQNPVKENYPGRKNVIRVHRGFYKYLMRLRKDTGTTKYDEIANKAYEYGSSMIGNDFEVIVNGYSLGGALATLFGFYASTDKRLTQNGPVKIFTYGMPYIASHTFADAFRHQERSKKVQHARIYNSNDIVAHIPLNMRPTRRGSTFVHVGIDVKLYPVHCFSSCFSTWPPRFRYNHSESALSSYWRALKMNTLLNMHFPWKIREKHGLPELQMRLKEALLVSEKAKDPMLQKTLDEAYHHFVYRA